ncbi:hypothetical protein L915_00594, partial [Phytophthora nicotianae]
MRCFATRWIRHSPENDIDEGDVSTGGLKQKVLPSVPKGRALSSSNKYIEAKVITEKIVDRLALQSTPTFRVALTWLENFFEVLNAGEVVNFSERGNPVFPRLYQVSPMEGAQLSQIPLEGVASPIHIDQDLVQVYGSQRNGEASRGGVVRELDAVGESTPSFETSTITKSIPNPPKVSPNSQQTHLTSVAAVTWSFAKRQVINGMTKAQRKRAHARAEAARARELTDRYREDKASK